MKETLERQWPEEIEEHLLAVAGHNTDVKKQHNQMEGEREEKKNDSAQTTARRRNCIWLTAS